MNAAFNKDTYFRFALINNAKNGNNYNTLVTAPVVLRVGGTLATADHAANTAGIVFLDAGFTLSASRYATNY